MKQLIWSAMILAGTTLLASAQNQTETDASKASNTNDISPINPQENSNAYSTSQSAMQTFNPSISAIIDMFYYNENSEEGMSHVKEDMPGFGGHAHEDEHDDHGHGTEKGFNLREVELTFSAAVDNYFKAQAIVAVNEEGAEVEEAWGQTTDLPWGFQAKAGKFFSDFGYINAKHPHEWDFTDQPLIYELALGGHGLNDLGVQASWLAPTPVYLLFGAEIFQGDNENMYVQEDADELPENDGPSLGVGWVKLAPLQTDQHELQLGLFGASGSHQEIHAEGGGTNYFDGVNWFAGADAVYKYDSNQAYGKGDATFQAEYFYRNKDLDQQGGADKITGAQDGYYMQGTYGLFPRWRGGLRWEQVGLTNKEEEDGVKEEFGDSWRASAMVDFRPSEFSQVRFQLSNGDYDTGDEGIQNVWEAFVQLTFSIGAHGAHQF